jgi:DNA-binding response OmpR family regulator
MKKILIVDNDPDFLETRAEWLDREGYEVYRAISLEQAEHVLAQRCVHVTIIDIRMRDENDDKDISGLSLAKQTAYRSIPKIILTKYPSYEYVREALGPALDDLPPAVDFTVKQEGPTAMLRAVERVFAKYVHINWNLTICWKRPSSFHHMVKLVDSSTKSTQLTDQASELEDLLRKLFYDSIHITIGRIFVQSEGMISLEVFAYGDQRVDEQYIVSCGRKETISNENTRYEKLVPKEIGSVSVSKVKTEETLHFAATAYKLIRCDLEDVVPFSEHYQTKAITEIIATLSTLYEMTLSPWYERGRYFEENRSLQELYRDWLKLPATPAFKTELESRVEGICREIFFRGLGQFDYSPHKITFHLSADSSVTYRNPASKVHDLHLFGNTPVLCGVTHGKVDADSILVDYRGWTWLLDFGHAGFGPLLCDFVLLETAIKLDLFDTYHLQARYTLEKQWLDVSTLGGPILSDEFPIELRKALIVVAHIRSIAAAMIGHDLRPYEWGLFFCSIHRIAAYQPDGYYTRRDLIRYAHSLLTAAMLCEKLMSIDAGSEHIPLGAETCLWFDRHREEIWVEGRQANLTPQEFNIFKVLYDHAGSLCTRQMITQSALGRDYSSNEESLFNSALSRLRHEIEPNPKKPQYIINIRGRGYRLEKQKLYVPQKEQQPSI